MPSGLDGNPEPIRSEARAAVLATVAARLDAIATAQVTFVAIDGIDGAGKSTFADELTPALNDRGRSTIRATIDSFHNPRALRWRQGRISPRGFYEDSHDLAALEEQLLDPLAAGVPFRRAAFDEPSDRPVEAPYEWPSDRAILLFDGIFLQRPELHHHWDVTIFVDGQRRVTESRIERAIAGCPPGGPAAVWHLVRWWALLDRYVGGQRLYFAQCEPRSRADIVIDNNDLAAPTIM